MIRLLLAAMLLGATAASAQVPADASPRAPRTVSADVLEAARAERQFTYAEPAEVPQGESVWSMILRALGRLFNAATHPGGRPIQYGLLALLVLWLIVRIARMEPSAAVRRAAAQVRAGSDMPEDLSTRDFLQEARSARAGGDVRLAVRFLFLHVLRRLDAAGRISYRPEKTNRAYLREVGAALRPGFAPFVRAFESAWYGGFSPEAAEYDQLEADFAAFESSLTEADAR